MPSFSIRPVNNRWLIAINCSISVATLRPRDERACKEVFYCNFNLIFIERLLVLLQADLVEVALAVLSVKVSPGGFKGV